MSTSAGSGGASGGKPNKYMHDSARALSWSSLPDADKDGKCEDDATPVPVPTAAHGVEDGAPAERAKVDAEGACGGEQQEPFASQDSVVAAEPLAPMEPKGENTSADGGSIHDRCKVCNKKCLQAELVNAGSKRYPCLRCHACHAASKRLDSAAKEDPTGEQLKALRVLKRDKVHWSFKLRVFARLRCLRSICVPLSESCPEP